MSYDTFVPMAWYGLSMLGKCGWCLLGDDQDQQKNSQRRPRLSSPLAVALLIVEGVANPGATVGDGSSRLDDVIAVLRRSAVRNASVYAGLCASRSTVCNQLL